MSKQNMPSDELVKIAVAALEEIKATDITVIDVKDKTTPLTMATIQDSET